MNVSALISSLYVTVIAGQELEAKALEHHERRTAGRFCRKTLSVHAVKRKPGVEFLARLKVNYARANLTNCDPGTVAELRLVGRSDEANELSEAILKAIASSFPELVSECARQLQKQKLFQNL